MAILLSERQARRMLKTRRSGGVRLKEWYLGDARLCTAVLTRDPSGLVVAATITLPIDVPSKPRTTQNSTWQPSYKNYMSWRDVWRDGVTHALEAARHQGDGEPLFSPATMRETPPKPGKGTYLPPLVVHAVVTTKLQGDADNRTKSLLDAGNGVFWEDDRRVAWTNVLVVPAYDAAPLCTTTIQVLPQEDRKERALAWHASMVALTAPHQDAPIPEVARPGAYVYSYLKDGIPIQEIPPLVWPPPVYGQQEQQ